MLRVDLGRTGLVVLAIVFGLLAGEDLLIYLNRGTLPAIEFLLIDVLVLGIIIVAITEARRRQPP